MNPIPDYPIYPYFSVNTHTPMKDRAVYALVRMHAALKVMFIGLVYLASMNLISVFDITKSVWIQLTGNPIVWGHHHMVNPNDVLD